MVDEVALADGQTAGQGGIRAGRVRGWLRRTPPAAAVPAVAAALARTSAQRVFVCNLRPQLPETAGYDVGRHVDALADHGVTLDVVLCDTGYGMALGSVGPPVLDRPLAGPNGLVHDPGKLASALSDLLR